MESGNELSRASSMPTPFKRGSVFIYIVVFAAAYVATYALDPSSASGLDRSTALSFLNTNTEILVAIFTVTMGVTLLGLQFRAQSYTMLALIEYVKDAVIYGFILVFVTLISFSILASTLPDWINPITATPYAVIGTVFSLIYLVGYIYYMIGKTQPEQVIQQVAEGIRKTEASDIVAERDIFSKKFEAFQIWEQIMLRAVESDNAYIFRRGMVLILCSADICMRSYQDEKKDLVGKFFFQYISTIMFSCVRADRDRFVRLFMDHFKETDEVIPDSEEKYARRRMMAFHVWQHVMREAIMHRNMRILRYGMIAMDHVFGIYIQRQGPETRPPRLYSFTHTWRAWRMMRYPRVGMTFLQSIWSTGASIVCW